jgi:hypothetical protein
MNLSAAFKELIITDINCLEWNNKPTELSPLDQAIKATFDLVSTFEEVGPLVLANSIIYSGQKNMVMLVRFHSAIHNQIFLEKFKKFEFNGQPVKMQPAVYRNQVPNVDYPDTQIIIMNQDLIPLYSNARMHPKRLELIEVEENRLQGQRFVHPAYPAAYALSHASGLNIDAAASQNQFMWLKNATNSPHNLFKTNSIAQSLNKYCADESSDQTEDSTVEKEVSMINSKKFPDLMPNNNVVFFPSLNYFYYSSFY